MSLPYSIPTAGDSTIHTGCSNLLRQAGRGDNTLREEQRGLYSELKRLQNFSFEGPPNINQWVTKDLPN